MKSLIWISVLFSIIIFISGTDTFSQRRVVQLSGVVLAADSVDVVAGAHVYVPMAGRGATSNGSGFFSLPVLVGDSVVITSMGYLPRHYLIPEAATEFWTVIIEMTEDAIVLPDVTIMAFPTEEAFKDKIVNTLPPDTRGINKGLSPEVMTLLARTTPMDGAGNYRNYMSQYPSTIQDRFMPVTNPFFNVINWAKFLKQLKQQRKDAANSNR